MAGIPARNIKGRTVPYCPGDDGSLPLPPEQRGVVHRALADNEGVVPGRYMDLPLPGEILGGAVGLTVAMATCLLPVSGAAPGFDQAAEAQATEPEGTELRVLSAEPGESVAGGAGEPSESTSEADGDYTPDCVTVPPPFDCLPGGPLDTGVKIRHRSGPRMLPYGREPYEDLGYGGVDADGKLPSLGECGEGVVTFTVQAASCAFPLHLLAPEAEGAKQSAPGTPPAV